MFTRLFNDVITHIINCLKKENNMKKKTYTKPYFILEEFTPQEYIAGCVFQSISGLITHNSNYFIDWNQDGNYDDGERKGAGSFTPNPSCTITKTKSNIYWISKASNENTAVELTPNLDAPYTGTYHHYYNGKTTDYIFHSYTSQKFNIKIVDNTIMYSNNLS